MNLEDIQMKRDRNNLIKELIVIGVCLFSIIDFIITYCKKGD